jgi:protoporphyrinogen oxidase
MEIFDYIIIGGGPTGLTLSYLLGLQNIKCLLIDDAESLGGCNRVDRKNSSEYFTEHSPRIITSAYANFMTLLKMIGTSFEDLYIPYNFSIANIGGKAAKDLNKRDLSLFVLEFIKLIFNEYNGYNTSVENFMNKHNMQEKTKDYIDRLCRLTDGSGMDRYSLYAVLQLINQQGLHKIYQPRYPNDDKLFKIWETAIEKTGNVKIIKNTPITKINIHSSDSVSVTSGSSSDPTYSGKNIVLAVHPKAIQKLILDSKISNDVFGIDFTQFSIQNSYIEDIGITYHWKNKIDIPKIYGFPATDWRVGFIVNSNYTKDLDKYSKTLISAVILDLNTPSKRTGKTANETKNVDELTKEVFYQLKESYPDLPEADKTILNPRVRREDSKWISLDSSYFMSYNQNKFINFQSPIFKNLFAVGTLNGKSSYVFTSIESAVTNAFSFVNSITASKINIIKQLEIRDIIWIIIIVILLIVFIIKIKSLKIS